MVSVIIQQLLSQGEQDEKFLFIAFLILSQMGEYLPNSSEISPIIPVVVTCCTSPNPALRYACYHCFGQLSVDLGPSFQAQFGDIVLPTLVVGIKDKVKFYHCRF